MGAFRVMTLGEFGVSSWWQGWSN